jgi:hypothetical protein
MFSLHKRKRVIRYSMAAEILVFVDGYDAGILLKHDTERMLRQNIPIGILTDTKALFDVVTRSKCTTEKRLMIDLEACR